MCVCAYIYAHRYIEYKCMHVYNYIYYMYIYICMHLVQACVLGGT